MGNVKGNKRKNRSKQWCKLYVLYFPTCLSKQSHKLIHFGSEKSDPVIQMAWLLAFAKPAPSPRRATCSSMLCWGYVSLASSCSHLLFLLPIAKCLRKPTYWTLKWSLSAVIQIMYCLYQTVPSALPILCLAIVMQHCNGHPVRPVRLVQLNHFLQKWRIIYSTEIGLTLGIALLKPKCQSNPQWNLK